MRTKFEKDLETLVAMEMAAAIKAKDADRCAIVTEHLARSLAMTVAMSCKGNAKGIDTMLEGLTQYLYEMAGTYQKLGQLVTAMPEKGTKPS